ncbi:MAG: glycosyltransferase family 39 protein [Verrucomicrobia bacterium]|nr:glycosyltransferase family 39 protein [Verrucomicrobiota bacterium]
MNPRLKLWHLLAVFALALLPFAATFALPYPDERHYTDGAMQMLRDHDWLVPKTPENGTTNWLPRFHKPPLAYWVTAASFATFGVNVFAARLPFLLASCGTIFLTWRLARKLTGNATTALLAALILATHVQFVFAATRSIPDALLIFFVTLGAFGFLRLIAFGEFTTGAFWTAYGGAAGAVWSKGLLGVGIVLFAWAFVAVRERKFSAVKKLLHAPSLALAAALVLAWFAYIFHRYGAAAWHTFFDDQVSGNLHGGWWSPLWRAPVFALILAVNFLPWSLPAIEAWLRGKRLPTVVMPAAARTWSAVLVVGFALGSNVSVRYLLPAAPLMAVLVADILAGAADAKLIFSPRQIMKFLLGTLAVLLAVAIGINLQWGLTLALILAGALFLAAGAALAWGALRRGWFSATEGAGLALLLIFPLLFFAISPVTLPDPTQQMADTLARTRLNSAKPVLFIGSPAKASGIRLFSGGKFVVVRTEFLDLRTAGNFAAVLGREKDLLPLAMHGYRLQLAAVIPGAPPRREWLPALRERRLPEALRNAGEKFILATRD